MTSYEISVMLRVTNIVIEYRSADGKPDRVPSLVAELVKLKVDVLVSGDDPTIRVAKQATKTIPIVMNQSGSSCDWPCR